MSTTVSSAAEYTQPNDGIIHFGEIDIWVIYQEE
jgi:hypothetical protein